MSSRDGVRQTLIRRVSQKVSGHGIARRSIEGAVDRVLSALPADASSRARSPEVLGATRSSGDSLVAVLAATSAPDLASRARLILEREGQRVFAIGTATAGRHTAVTLQVAGVAGPALERVARELGASLTVLDPAAADQVRA